MSPRILITTLAAFAASAVPTAPGIASLSWSNVQAATPTAAVIVDADPQLLRVREAIEAAERGDFDAVHYADLAHHPLYAWIEYVGLRRDIDSLSNAQAQSFLSRYDGQAAAEAFREIWVAETSRREDWPSLLAAWKPAVGRNTELRCAELQARQALGRTDEPWVSDAQALWRSTGKTLPDNCDGVFAALAAKGGLTAELRWERIDKAAAEWLPTVMRSAARGLPA
ncbi:MAG TPA: hypothetical protein VGQ93_16305, partial [Lysobacter sp.]|nr:hypothetical protein [Lysobacter sp.]